MVELPPDAGATPASAGGCDDLIGPFDPETGLLDRHGLEAALVHLALDGAVPALVVDIGLVLVSTGTSNARATEREVGARLSALCRGEDLVARCGPGVFVLVAAGLDDAADITGMVTRLRDALRPFRTAIGAVLVRSATELPDAHLRAARARRRIERGGDEHTVIEL